MRAHCGTLVVESSLWRNGSGHCDKCCCAAVKNEVHGFLNIKTCLCALSERSICSFITLFARTIMWRSLTF